MNIKGIIKEEVDDFQWIRDIGPDKSVIDLISLLVKIKTTLPKSYINSVHNKKIIIKGLLDEVINLYNKFEFDSPLYRISDKLRKNLESLLDIISGSSIINGHWIDPYSKKQNKRIKQNIEFALDYIIKGNESALSKFEDNSKRYFRNY